MLLTNFKFVLVKIFTVFSHWQAAMIAYFLHTAIGILEAEPPVAFFFLIILHIFQSKELNTLTKPREVRRNRLDYSHF